MARSDTASREALLILAIIKRIPRNRWVTSTALAAGLEEAGWDVARRRLQRILKDLVDNADFNIECDMRSKPFSYRQAMPDPELVKPELSPQMSLVLRMAQEFLSRQLPVPLMESVGYLFDEAKETLRENGMNDAMDSWLKKVAFVPNALPMLPPQIKPRIFSAVSEALYRESKLAVTYVNNLKEERTAIVSPLGLVQQEFRVYLVCQFEGYDDCRHLALHRMISAQVMDAPALRPQNFELDRYVSSRHFNYSNGSKLKLLLEFSNRVTAQILEETPFEKGQKLKQLPDGFWQLEAVVDVYFMSLES